MKYFFVTLAFVTTVFGGKINPRSTDVSSEESRKYEGAPLNAVIGSENARVFSQEDQLFPAKFIYPTYPEYVDVRYANGYNGHNTHVIPATTNQEISSWAAAWTRLIPITSFALLYGAKAGIYLFSVFLILIVGIVFTTTICTFTPICTISFPAFALTKNQVKEQVAALARSYITPENLNAATIYVQNAVDKISNIQSMEEEKTTNRPTSTIKPESSTHSST